MLLVILVCNNNVQQKLNIFSLTIEVNRTERTGTNIFYEQVQELPNKYYSTNQQDTVTLEDLYDVGKMTCEMEQAVMAYPEDDAVVMTHIYRLPSHTKGNISACMHLPLTQAAEK
jgi:hypothetical protein